MRIKHWQGYGNVTATKCKDSTPSMLHIEVQGNHEWGIVREDEFDLYHWLVVRFDKNVQDYPDWHRSHPIIEVRPGWRNDPKLGCIDTCDYYFTY